MNFFACPRRLSWKHSALYTHFSSESSPSCVYSELYYYFLVFLAFAFAELSTKTGSDSSRYFYCCRCCSLVFSIVIIIIHIYYMNTPKWNYYYVRLLSGYYFIFIIFQYKNFFLQSSFIFCFLSFFSIDFVASSTWLPYELIFKKLCASLKIHSLHFFSKFNLWRRRFKIGILWIVTISTWNVRYDEFDDVINAGSRKGESNVYKK